MSENISRRAAVKLVLLAVFVAVAIAVPTAVWASHQFNDVPTSHPFHDEISAISDAGITTGFVDGGFHPSAAVTRQAMAAFLGRGLGRIGSNSTTGAITLTPNGSNPMTGVFVDSGAVSGGAGLALLTGTATVETFVPAECPCEIDLSIRDLQTLVTLATTTFNVDGQGAQNGVASASATVQAVVSVPGGSTQQFALVASLHDTSTNLTAVGTLSALYGPFGPDGDDTAAWCSAQEGEPNGAIGQAEPFAGPAMFGCVEPAGDVDYFSIAVPGGGHVLTAATTGLAGAGTCDLDTFVRIRASDGTIFGVDDDGGPGTCSLATSGQLIGGTYYVEVSGFGGLSTGSYRLTTSLVVPPGSTRDEGDKD